jgi:hypothetical protein
LKNINLFTNEDEKEYKLIIEQINEHLLKIEYKTQYFNVENEQLKKFTFSI